MKGFPQPRSDRGAGCGLRGGVTAVQASLEPSRRGTTGLLATGKVGWDSTTVEPPVTAVARNEQEHPLPATPGGTRPQPHRCPFRSHRAIFSSPSHEASEEGAGSLAHTGLELTVKVGLFILYVAPLKGSGRFCEDESSVSGRSQIPRLRCTSQSRRERRNLTRLVVFPTDFSGARRSG